MTIKHQNISSISYLEKIINKHTLFLSNWNIDGIEEGYGEIITKLQDAIVLSDYIKYRYPDELFTLKKIVENELDNKLNASIFPSATVGNYLLSNVLKNKGLKNILMIAPCYYSYLNIYFSNEFNVYSYVYQDINQIKIECIEKNIDVLVYTDPLFCESISIQRKFLKWCNDQNIFVIIDCVYGNMYWDRKFHDFLHYYNIYKDNENTIIIDSITKKAYLNGIKTALFLTKRIDILTDMEFIFNYSASPFSAGTLTFLEQYLKHKNRQMVDSKINFLLDKAKNNYELINTYLIGTSLKIEPCNQGFWSIIHLDLRHIANKSPQKIAVEIMEKKSIFTIPMNTYFKDYGYYYSFRINLLNDIDMIHCAINKLIQYNSELVE